MLYYFRLEKARLLRSVMMLLVVAAAIVGGEVWYGMRPVVALTTAPTTMSFQGRLTNASGVVVPDGLYNMKFALYDAASGGSVQWSETRETTLRVQVTGGLFSTRLGEATSLNAAVFASGLRYFEITMATPGTATCSTASCASWESPMTSRSLLSTSAYAYNAETLDGLDSAALGQLSASNTWTGANMISSTSTTALKVQSATGTNALTVDTVNGRITTQDLTTSSVSLLPWSSVYHNVYWELGANRSIAGGYGTDAWLDAGTGVYNFATAYATNPGDIITENSVMTIANNGAAAFQNAANSTTAFGIYNSSGASLFAADTTNNKLVLGASTSLALTGGITASRPGSPAEGMIYYDTTTKQLLTYSNGKWQSDSKTATFIVAASNSAQADKDGAQYVSDGEDSVGSGIGVPDGDQDQINAALTDAAAAGGGTVYLAPGTYTLDSSINVPNNVTLAGSGNSTVIQMGNFGSTTVNLPMIENDNNSTGEGVIVRDLQIDGRKSLNTNGWQSGIYFEHVGGTARQGGKIINVYAHHMHSSSIEIYNSVGTTVTGNTFSYAGGSAIYLNGSSSSTISSNTITNSDEGVDLLAGSSHNVIVGNTINSTTTNGIHVESASNSNTISGNTFLDNVGSSLYVTSSTHQNITGNTITNSGGIGVYLDTTSGNTVSGNAIRGSGDDGVSLYAADNNLVSDNKIQDSCASTWNDGISLYNSDINTVTGNSIVDSAYSISNNAIAIADSGSDKNYLADNVFSSAAGNASVYDVGTGTVYANQSTAENGGRIVIRTSDNTAALQIQNATGANLFSADTTNMRLSVNNGGIDINGLTPPTAPTIVLGSGGSLAYSTTYLYRLAAVNAADRTNAVDSSPTSVTTAGSGTTRTVNISWSAVADASGYYLYRSTDGGATWYRNYIAGGATTTAADNGSNFTWSGANYVGDAYYNQSSMINIRQNGQLVFNNGWSSIGSRATDDTLVIGNYAAGRGVIIQGDSLSFMDTTGYNENFVIYDTGATAFKNRVDTTNGFYIQNAAGSNLFTMDTTNANLSIASLVNVNGLFEPTAPTIALGSGGSLAYDTTYEYRLAAVNAAGRTNAVGSSPGSVVTASSGTVRTVNVSWSVVPGATGYYLYRTTDGGANWYRNYIAGGSTVGASDDGSAFTWSGTNYSDDWYSNQTSKLSINNNGNIDFNNGGATMGVNASGDFQLQNNAGSSGMIFKSGYFYVQNASSHTNMFIDNAGNGNALFQNSNDSSGAFQINSDSSYTLLNVDTANSYIINNATTAGGDNLLENPGFEGAVNAGSEATGWMVGSNFTIVADGSAHSGNYSYKVTGAVVTDQYDMPAFKKVSVQPGESVYGSVYVRNPTGGGLGGLFIMFRDAAGTSIGFCNSDWTNPGASFALRSASCEAPAGAVTATFYLTARTGATGDWYFDDAYFGKNTQVASQIFRNQNDSVSAFTVQNAAGYSLINTDTANMALNIDNGSLNVNGLTPPAAPSIALTTGGSLAYSTNYYYRLAAVNSAGRTNAVSSSPATVTTAGSGSDRAVTITWTPVPGATAYYLYRSTDGTTWYANDVLGGSSSSAVDDGTNFTWSGTDYASDVYDNSTSVVNINNNGRLAFNGGLAGISTTANTGVLNISNYAGGGGAVVQADSFTFQDTTGWNGNFTINNTGATTFQNRVDSATGFQIQNSSYVNLFTVDTSNARLYVGPTAGDTVGTLLVLGNKTNAGDPTGVAGGMYYNASAGKFRCYENGAWKDCITPPATREFLVQAHSSSSAWVIPASLTDFGNPNGNRFLTEVDTAGASQARIVVNMSGTTGTGAQIALQYSLNGTSGWTYLDNSTGPVVTVDQGSKVYTSSWISLTSGAIGDVYIRAVGLNGNGTGTSAFNHIKLQVR